MRIKKDEELKHSVDFIGGNLKIHPTATEWKLIGKTPHFSYLFKTNSNIQHLEDKINLEVSNYHVVSVGGKEKMLPFSALRKIKKNQGVVFI